MLHCDEVYSEFLKSLRDLVTVHLTDNDENNNISNFLLKGSSINYLT